MIFEVCSSISQYKVVKCQKQRNCYNALSKKKKKRKRKEENSKILTYTLTKLLKV